MWCIIIDYFQLDFKSHAVSRSDSIFSNNYMDYNHNMDNVDHHIHESNNNATSMYDKIKNFLIWLLCCYSDRINTDNKENNSIEDIENMTSVYYDIDRQHQHTFVASNDNTGAHTHNSMKRTGNVSNMGG